MLKNYLKTALRNLWHNKGFSAINISGLALGMACGLLILLWVEDEKSYDAFPAKKDRLFVVYKRGIAGDKVGASYSTAGLLAREIKKQFPQVEAASPLAWKEENTVSVGEKILKEDVNHADADFFKMFSYPLLEGDAEHALSGPQSMAISRKMADDLFGSPAAAIGQTVRYQNQQDYTVTAVFENLPSNVSYHFDCLINWQAFMKENDWLRGWGNSGPSTFIELKPGADAAVVEKQLTRFIDKYQVPTSTFRVELGLQKYSDQHLYGNLETGYPAGGRIEYVRLFTSIALFILLIACVNYMNLTTARSMQRAREIGVRKVMGAARALLIRQFIGEALLTTVLAAVMAGLLISAVLPAFNVLTVKHIPLPFHNLRFWESLLLLTLVTGLLSGLYPAFFLSGYHPVRVLKGALLMGGKGSLSLRKGLVVFQFTLSIVLILSTVLIGRQIRYIGDKDLGYDRDNLVYIPVEGDLGAKYDLFKNAALQLPGVVGVTATTDDLTNLQNDTRDLDWDGKDAGRIFAFAEAGVAYDFTATMKLQLLQGRDYSKDFPGDSNAYIINETALAQIGYKNPIGRYLSFWNMKGKIIGVVKDFNFESMHSTIRPIVFHQTRGSDAGAVIVRLQAGQTAQALRGLGQLAKEVNPKFPFTYQFADEQYAKLYQSEQVTGSLAVVFAGLAIVISCLGLLGLSMFSAERRAKEISIRKVLGAGAASLFGLLTLEFLLLIGLAFTIAVPLGWWWMHSWLQHYAFHTDIPWWLFATAGVMAVGVAMVTILFQTVRAVMVNPAVRLRSE